MILKAPFQLPPGFLVAFGYRYGRRFVALYWEPCGDESCVDDGERYSCGLTDNWLYLDFVRQPEVRRWLDETGINLGNSDDRATHCLIVDTLTNDDIYVAPTAEARYVLLTQALPATE